MRGETTFGSLVAIVQLLNYVVNPVARFAETISRISQATASSQRIGTVIDLPADDNISMSPLTGANRLVAENVSFAYHSEDEEDEEADVVLEEIDAVFPKGIITGLVGKSGSGKSTLLKLIIGLYAPNTGNISLIHDNGSYNGEAIMPHVAYVPPVDYLFSGTVLDNIVMSQDKPNMEEVRQAASDANILEFIESLPSGFDTIIGESGGTVSSGQAQRIAIARAIYKKSSILVFDEPTANLDTDSIEKFQSTIKRISKEKICIVVTHDESTMTVCDKVYLLEDGQVRVA
jgi:ABC-type bacteriocin/lantibiotic exporter with double-glycine peptidase domain